MLWKLLTQRGHYCELATNQLVGLIMVKATMDMDTDDLYLRCYDVILIDVIWPVLSGIDCIKAIRELGFKGVIVGTTSCIDPDIHNSLMKAGIDKVIIKSYTMKGLYESIELQ